MRLFVLAMTMFLLNLSVVIVDELGIYNINIATDSQWRDDIESVQSQRFDPDLSVDVSTSFGFGDFVSGFSLVVKILFRIVFIGTTLELFGVDARIAFFFGLGGIIIYGLGAAQFISNRGTKGMQ